MRKLFNAMLAISLMLSGAVVFAQETQDPMMQEEQGSDPMMQQEQMPGAGAQEQQDPEQFMDKQVSLQGGEQAGTVEDVYVDPQNDQPVFLVIATDQQEYKVIPAEKVSMEQDKVKAQIEKQQYDQAPKMSQQEYDQNQAVTPDLVSQSFQQYQSDESKAMTAESVSSGQALEGGGQQQPAGGEQMMPEEPATEEQQPEEQPLF